MDILQDEYIYSYMAEWQSAKRIGILFPSNSMTSNEMKERDVIANDAVPNTDIFPSNLRIFGGKSIKTKKWSPSSTRL
jgi:hypothetical protein